MKKMKRITIFLAAVAALLATACAEKSEMATYPAKSNEGIFAQSYYSLVSDDGEDATVAITLYRASSKGDASIPVTATTESPSVFDIPAEVAFKDGSAEATLMLGVKFSSFEPGEGADVVLSLGGAPTSLPYYTTSRVEAKRDYSYSVYAHGTYESSMLSALFGSYISWEMDLLVADQNPEYFRLKDFYYEFAGGRNYSDPGYNFDFLWDGESEEIIPVAELDEYGCATIDTGFFHPSYGLCSMYVDTDPEYTFYDADDRTFYFNYATLVSLGMLLDWDYDYFTLD